MFEMWKAESPWLAAFFAALWLVTVVSVVESVYTIERVRRLREAEDEKPIRRDTIPDYEDQEITWPGRRAS